MTKSPVSKKEGYAINEDTVVLFRQPGSFSADPLTDVLRSGAHRFLAQAVEAEVEAHIAAHSDLTDGQGRRRIVRHGYLPEREIQTGIGAVCVQAPRMRDCSGGIRFTSLILPRELLLDLKRRGLEIGPELAVGDGALGFWKALREVYGEAREQRCWVHKTINVLNQMPKSLQARAKDHLQDIWMAETKADAEAAFDFFVQAYGVKYDKAVERLIKDRDRLLAFYDFPAEHWRHIRTTNPIESTFATVRLRTVKTKGCLSRKTALAMTFKLILSAKRKWRKLNGSDQLADIIDGVPFKDGIKQIERAA